MDRIPPAAPAWAGRIAPLIQELHDSSGAPREARRAELWLLLHAALFAALRAQARRIIPVSAEDLEDLASAKSLELLQRAEGNRWEPGARSAGDLMGYLWRVARNALVDLARRRGREAPPGTNGASWDEGRDDHSEREAGPLDMTLAREFVSDLSGCLGGLSPRSRAVWTLRALLERPSREIAERLALKAAHVDVLVQRARQSLTQCMAAKGHTSSDVHPQAFVLLWARWSERERDETLRAAASLTRGTGRPGPSSLEDRA